jgi:hypothetical protein
MSRPRIAGFRLGVYIFKDAEVVDFAAPYGVFAVARRFDPEASGFGKVPIDRLAEIAPACRISRARVVDAGRIVTAGGIASGMELGFHLLRRAGYDEGFISEVARVMEYREAYNLYRSDLELATEAARLGV